MAGSSCFFYYKGQILPALLNNSGTRWALFCLISCVCSCVPLCVCVACTSIGATCLPCLTCEETGVCTLRGVCLCVCVYSQAFLRTSSPCDGLTEACYVYKHFGQSPRLDPRPAHLTHGVASNAAGKTVQTGSRAGQPVNVTQLYCRCGKFLWSRTNTLTV